MQLIVAAFVEGFLCQHSIELHPLADISDISDFLQYALHYQILFVDFFPLLSVEHYAPLLDARREPSHRRTAPLALVEIAALYATIICQRVQNVSTLAPVHVSECPHAARDLALSDAPQPRRFDLGEHCLARRVEGAISHVGLKHLDGFGGVMLHVIDTPLHRIQTNTFLSH